MKIEFLPGRSPGHDSEGKGVKGVVKVGPPQGARDGAHNFALRFNHINLIRFALELIEGEKAGFPFLVETNWAQDGTVAGEFEELLIIAFVSLSNQRDDITSPFLIKLYHLKAPPSCI